MYSKSYGMCHPVNKKASVTNNHCDICGVGEVFAINNLKHYLLQRKTIPVWFFLL